VDIILGTKIEKSFNPKTMTRDDIKKINIHEIKQQQLINILNMIEWRDKNFKDKSFHEILREYDQCIKTQISNFNQKQLAIKVGANSTYGFCSAGGSYFFDRFEKIVRLGMFPVIPISECVTFIGRKVILRSVEYVEETYQGFKVIYADTDSLFILVPKNVLPPNKEGIEQSFPFAEKIAAEITKLFSHEGSTMKIVHEKTATNLILWCAKCYAYLKHEKGKHPKIDVKGISSSKRDCSKFISNLCNKIINVLIQEGRIEKAFEIIREHLQNILDDSSQNPKINKEDFVIYKRINKTNYDKSNQQAHAILAQNIEKRTPGFGPKIGESVSMVYIDVGDYNHKLKASEKVEDFDWILKNNLQIDYHWYMKNEFTKKLNLILAPLMKKSNFSNIQDIINPFADTYKVRKTQNLSNFNKKTNFS
jgi:DNA polymerase elongation subunit (family B)